MDKTQPNTRTLIGLFIGAIVLVAGLLLISNAGGGSATQDISPTQTRVALAPTEEPQAEASPIPAQRRDGEDEDVVEDIPSDKDGDGIPDEQDACPDEGDIYGLGVDGSGCPILPPPPPSDRDGDGVPDEQDACPDEGDVHGLGIDGSGCPILPPPPPSDRDGDGIPDDQDACPDEGDVHGLGIDGSGCPILPPPPSDRDGDGIIDEEDLCPDEGDAGGGVDRNGCPLPAVELPPAVASINFEFTDIPAGATCQVLILDDADLLVATLDIPAVDGTISGFYEYDPGVVSNPRAEIGCAIVPDVAPAILPYEFTGLSGVASCTLTIVNIGDGDPAILGEETGLIPDGNGTIAGEIGILIGAGDIPEAQIGCVSDPLPPAPETVPFPYTFSKIFEDDEVCTITAYDANNNNEILAQLFNVRPVSGVIDGIIDIPADRANTAIDVGFDCVLLQRGTFTYRTENNEEGTTCFLFFVDENGDQVPDAGDEALAGPDGVIELTYTIPDGQAWLPQIVCLAPPLVIDDPEATPEPPTDLGYQLDVEQFCSDDFPQITYSVYITAVDNYPALMLVYTSGEYTQTDTFFDVSGIGITYPMNGGVGLLQITDMTNNITYDYPSACQDQPAYGIQVSSECERDTNTINFQLVMVGDYHTEFAYEYVSGDFTDTGFFSFAQNDFAFYNNSYEASRSTLTLTEVNGTGRVFEFEQLCSTSDNWGLVYIDKDWTVGLEQRDLNAPAEGGDYFAPTTDIPNLIVVSSQSGQIICDWFALFNRLECRTLITNRPVWYRNFDGLPVPPNTPYTVTENVPEGWQVVSGTGTFTIGECSDSYTYTQWYEENGEEFVLDVTECWHTVVNETAMPDVGDYYVVRPQKEWLELFASAGGLNSPAFGSVGPTQSYYPLLTFSSSVGTGWCDWWYSSWNGTGYLDCYFRNNVTFPYYNGLLVPTGESYTITEVAVAGFRNLAGLGTFNLDTCASGTAFAPQTIGGPSYDFDFAECYHTVINQRMDGDYYQVQPVKLWNTGNMYTQNSTNALSAPAQGGYYGEGPFYNIANLITVESSLMTGTCDWVFNTQSGGRLVCRYVAKDGQNPPDLNALWVPLGESYAISENVPQNWQNTGGLGTFSQDECTGWTQGNLCNHLINNYTETPDYYSIWVDKFWAGFECDDDYDCYEDDCDYYDDCYEDCYDCTAGNTGNLNAPAQGGNSYPGPDVYISNLITVTSDLGSMTCDWKPDYYDSYYQLTYGYLRCRVTSSDPNLPLLYRSIWVQHGGTFTITENVPQGWRVVSGTGTFTADECGYDYGYGRGAGESTFQYMGEGGGGFATCYVLVVNEPTQDPEPTPTPEPTPIVTPTAEVTPVVTPTEEITPIVTPTAEVTPVVTPTEEITPIVTPTEEITPAVTTTPDPPVTEEPTPATPEEPTPTPEVTPTPTVIVECPPFTLSDDGFPIINMSNASCGRGEERPLVNFSAIRTGGLVCVPDILYHSNEAGTWDIWRVSNTTDPENLSNGADGIISMAPTRSGDGRYVAYVSNADGDWEIYVVDTQTGTTVQLTDNDRAIDLDPVWSPNGRYIAYESNVDGNWEIRLIDLFTGAKARLTSHPANDINPFWHPDSGRIAFQSDRTGEWQIFVLDIFTGALRRVSDGIGADFDPTFSHDGERIAFRSIRDGEEGIYIIPTDGGLAQRISPAGFMAGTPVWSSDDRYIAFQAYQTGVSLNDIYVYDTQTGETRQITSNDGALANVQDVAPTWICNSTTLVFTSDVKGNNRLYAVEALPMDAPPVDMSGVASLTDNEFNNRDPQNTPAEENGSRLGALPATRR